jgi:hypothetical protein
MATSKTDLVPTSDIERRLATIETVDDAKLVARQAEALRSFAKKIGAGLGTQNRAAAIKLLAEIKAGHLLAETVERGRPSKRFHRGTFLPAGITKKQSHRWQAISQVSAAEILKRETEHTKADRELTSREIYNLVTRQRRDDANQRTLATKTKLAAAALGVHHGDFRQLAPQILPDNSAQLVLTDPPYDQDSIGLFEAAAAEAARVLVPGGSFVAYSGQKYLGEVITACAQHLTYWWLFALVHEGSAQLLQKLGVRCEWKPIVWFVKRTRGDVSAIIPDLVRGAGREKDQHKWQQGEAEAADLIERLTAPDDLVVDFMAGSGTVPAAAKRLSRRFVAFETQADHIKTILRRIA